MTIETSELARTASAEQESHSRAVHGWRGRGLDAFVKGLGISDTGSNGQVLIVVNEVDLATLLAYCLTAAGFHIRLADREAGALSGERDIPDVVLLDSSLPDARSADIFWQIRTISASQRAPAIVVLIRGEEDIDPRLGLDLGRCNFVLYPLSVRDLVLHVESLVRMRRDAIAETPTVQRRGRYIVGPLDLDVDRHTALVNDVMVQLSPMEMRLLAYLVTHRDRVCSRDELLTNVWGYRAGVLTRAADVHIKRLRDKLGPAASLIVTIRGTGYRLSADFPVVRKD